MALRTSRSTLFPYTTLFRSRRTPSAWSEPTYAVRAPAHRTSTPTSGTSRAASSATRSEEHTSELQSRVDLVCRLLLEKKKELPNADSRHGLQLHTNSANTIT